MPLTALLLALVLWAAPPPVPASYALWGAQILDLATGTWSTASLVLVSGDRITRIAPESEYRAGLADSTVDLTGRYLIPGLDGDPLQDLASLQRPRLVMARGRVVVP